MSFGKCLLINSTYSVGAEGKTREQDNQREIESKDRNTQQNPNLESFWIHQRAAYS
jgi:hypothetical protein